MAATLAILAVVGAVATYVVDKRDPTVLFYPLVLLAVLAFIVSGIYGGQGINTVRQGVFKEQVAEDLGGREFRNQTMLILAGIVLFGLAILAMGPAKSDPTVERLVQLSATVQKQNDTIAQLSARVDGLAARVEAIPTAQP
jgi:cell division protein FtsB